ncbi:MAG: RNA methyltransferase [Synechococcales bacterium]|nr:RNA methyltransferase [Synechococcales bacterium]
MANLKRTSRPLHPVARHQYADLPRHPLILCASLVQNPANLGGLCRIADVFRLEALVVPDLAQTQTRAFRGTAASAHQWQPILSCNTQALPAWMQLKRIEGYCCIALHCAADAAPLGQFQYPQKTVLLLGQELTGLPDAVLADCDRQIVVQQYGLVESLNVQQAAAIAVYEYIRQRYSG